ncbi:MAG: type I-E CRISPR-associated protein Cse1/CasA [Clostridiales bacterium]|nr:type I-E CRISPR-associated protein Cse1/CasA [Clostridiales bacterium]
MEFNLLREPWLPVMRPDGGVEEVSMIDIFRRAPSFERLAGELPTQDVAVLRLLLAVLHTVFARYDPKGTYAPLYKENGMQPRSEDALDRWETLWKGGVFPMPVIENYLMQFEDRFWLFHPERPFYQVPELTKGTEYTAAKLNGELSESSNKIRLFPQRTGSSKSGLTYGEAARWLLYVNGFDDTSAKPTVSGLGSPGAGWLGKLGLVTAVGSNLFETLMLNLVLLKDGTSIWEPEEPVWEAKTVVTTERRQIPMPNNPSALLTLQSRRLKLKQESGRVTGYMLLGGDFFPKENALAEQMSVWRNAAKKENEPPVYLPKRHDTGRQLWRDFSALAVQTEKGQRPGIVNWLATLAYEGLIPRSLVCFQASAIQYGDKDFFVDNVFSDSVSFNAQLLNDLDQSWTSRILDAISTADQLAEQVGWLAQNIAKAAGNTSESGFKAVRDSTKEQAYYRMDIPFRQWLEKINPESQQGEVSKSSASKEWWETAQRIARGLGRDIVAQAGANAFVGREIKENQKERWYTAPEAYNRFLYCTSTVHALQATSKGGKKNGQ